MKCKVTVDTSHYPKEWPWELPRGWAWSTIEDISNCILYGVSESAKSTGSYKLLRITDIQEGKVDWDKVPFTDFDENKAEKYLLNDGDILFARTGATVGKSYLTSEVPQAALFASYLIRVRYSNLMSPQYVKLFFESGYYWEQISSSSVGVGQPNVNGTSLGKLKIPIPPVAEQHRVAEEAYKLINNIDELDCYAEALNQDITATKSTIIDLAVHGKLVPQDPSDEPAIDLLKRINPDFVPSDNLHYKDCPKGWIIVTVADVFEINPKIQGDEDADAGFVPMTNIRDGFCNMFSFEVRKWAKIKNGFTRFANGDIAVAKISPCLENRKSVIMRDLPNGIGAGTTELNIFRSRVVDPEYGLLFFKSKYFINSCAGSYNGVVGQQRVSRSLIEEMQFLLPPLEEQKRIVATINEYFAVINEISYSLQ